MCFYFIAISKKGYGFSYKRDSVIKCNSKKQAERIAELLNNHFINYPITLNDDEEYTVHYDSDNFIAYYYTANLNKKGLSFKKVGF